MTTAQNVIDATTLAMTKVNTYSAKIATRLATLTAIADKAAASETAAQGHARAAANAAASIVAGSGSNSGGTNAGTGTTNPVSSAVATVIARVKAAAAAVTAKTPGAIVRATGVTVTYGSANRQPDQIPGANGAYERHWISGPGNNGVGDLLSKAVIRSLEVSAPGFGGLVQFQSGDGSSAHGYMQGAAIDGSLGNPGDISDFGIGIRHTGRAIGFASSNNRNANLYVDGKLVEGRQSWTGDGSYVYYDFGSSGTRNLYFRGGADGVWGELAIKPGDTIEKFDFLANSYPLTWMGDSWGQGGAFSTIGLSLPQMIAAMVGSNYVGGNSIGGTGYIQEAGNPNALGAGRRASFNAGSPMLGIVELGINDPYSDAFVANVNATLDRMRADNPNMILVPLSWCSAQNRASGAGSENQRRLAVKAKIMSMAGPWIYIDGFDGMWYCSSGAKKAMASGPMITGNGSFANPLPDGGNANTLIDNDGGRHLTQPAGNVYAATWVGDLLREAIAAL